MARYRLQVSCHLCGALHLLPVAYALRDGPPEKQSIAEAYGENVPNLLAFISSNVVECPTTGRRFAPQNSWQVFLLPIEGLS
jgi:hypothetical protein